MHRVINVRYLVYVLVYADEVRSNTLNFDISLCNALKQCEMQ